MPQIPKTEEQHLLEERISKTNSLLRTMKLQLAAIRRRNKAARERERRQCRTQDLKEKQCRAFEELWRDAALLDAASEKFAADDMESMPKKRKVEETEEKKFDGSQSTGEVLKYQIGGSCSSKDKK